ncbi:BCL2 associated agonist of cell death b [Cyprinodon tularosa]|uniref:BCL2 associated agonist of cell death n=1 Tax=Cyprinodon variegatus TaxID=28743 RepID=A0A3Q2D5S0_CYPVA|nr:PREDICTED: bcl2-associated agonist of cell death [Cyprinodon variegatus]XP_038130710.1 BCL2 associated agonist of cell death b [Cyprinodon tularosa]
MAQSVETSDPIMAATFTISDSDTEPSEEVEETRNKEPRIRNSGKTHRRIRLSSESHAFTREEEARGEEEVGTPTEGYPFRGRSNSAPPALWAAKKYGRQLRRMSDEFVTLLDKGELRKVSSTGTNRPIRHSKSWWSYLFSHQEMEGENSHHENHTQCTEQRGE